MLWKLKKHIGIRNISNFLRTHRPFYVPPIIAIVRSGTDTNRVLKVAEEVQHAIASHRAHRKFLRDITPERKRPWSSVKTRCPLRNFVEYQISKVSFKDFVKLVHTAVRIYEDKNGPLVPRTSSRGRPRTYDYSLVIAAVIAGKMYKKQPYTAVREAVSSGISVSKDAVRVPTRGDVHYIRTCLERRNPEALDKIIELTDRMCIALAIDLFEMPVMFKSVDWSGLGTDMYLIVKSDEGYTRRRAAHFVTFVTRYTTNTIVQVINGEPRDIDEYLNERELICIGDDGYRAVKPVMASVREGWLFLTPMAINQLDGVTRELAQFLYKFRKPVERPYGQFEKKNHRLYCRRVEMRRQEIRMWAIAKNLWSYLGLKAISKLVLAVGRQDKKELMIDAVHAVRDSLYEHYWR